MSDNISEIGGDWRFLRKLSDHHVTTSERASDVPTQRRTKKGRKEGRKEAWQHSAQRSSEGHGTMLLLLRKLWLTEATGPPLRLRRLKSAATSLHMHELLLGHCCLLSALGSTSLKFKIATTFMLERREN